MMPWIWNAKKAVARNETNFMLVAPKPGWFNPVILLSQTRSCWGGQPLALYNSGAIPAKSAPSDGIRMDIDVRIAHRSGLETTPKFHTIDGVWSVSRQLSSPCARLPVDYTNYPLYLDVFWE